ncbi:MAG: DUF3501 family protein [Gammaproteobacteria bacterium]|nr:DUF3501 family protein [Gammaproteobacteria bacterium]
MERTNENTDMQKLTRDDLFSLEQYAEARPEFRSRVMAHKKNRHVQIGEHATLYFEDKLTMQYQIQEMLRVERIFEADGINEELNAYNPLIPDGDNWKATFMIEYTEVEQRKEALAKMIGIEKRVWVKVDGYEHVWAIADEDLERDTEEKTSSVHFLRFQLTPDMVFSVKNGASVGMGIEHEAYCHQVDPIPSNIRDSLSQDLD